MGIKKAKNTPPKSSPSKDRGMSLIETLIFVAIVTIVLVTLTSISASMTRQMRINYNKVYATHYAEEVADWLRVQKEVSGWNTFFAKAMDTAASDSYCMNDAIEINSTLNLSLANGYSVTSCLFDGIGTVSPTIFRRRVEFSQAGPTNIQNSVKAKIIVEWNESGGKLYKVEINTIYAPQ